VRVLIDREPYTDRPENAFWYTRGIWPCAWIRCPDAGAPPFVTAYRRRFVLDQAVTIRVHVSADERYELFLDGVRIGRGSERGDPANWFFETYDLALGAGPHVLVARVWALGDVGPVAQMRVYPGFILSPDDPAYLPLLGTGVAEWEARTLDGYSFERIAAPGYYFAVGSNTIVDGSRFVWGFERGDAEGWVPAETIEPGVSGFTRVEFHPQHMLKPATLPPMLDQPFPAEAVRFVAEVGSTDTRDMPISGADSIPDEMQSWSALLASSQPLTIPSGTRRRVLIDLRDYVCAYPELLVSGGRGSTISLSWAEALFQDLKGGSKGNRDEIEGKYFVGLADTFLPDGGAHRRFDLLWWKCGRYLEVVVSTGDEPLVIEGWTLRETRYPLEMESRFAGGEARLTAIVPIMLRALQMCAHETYMDCPYYEQLMYAGDTRLEVLITYAITRDDRLPRKALRMFDASRLPRGLTQSRYPSHVTQIIPPFSLWWVAMVYDYAAWRDDLPFVRDLIPGVREVLDRFLLFRNGDGLVEAPSGWNFMDWAPEWRAGVPPDGELGVSGLINWQLALVLTLGAQLEEWLGEAELAARTRRAAADLARQITARFWDEERGLFADDLAHARFSEHTQCLAILSGLLDYERRDAVAHGLLHDPELVRTTIYFTHYLFEAYTALGRSDALLARLQPWLELPAQGFKTTFEMPEPSRSDCHAWGAHPLYHYFASILGIRPAAQGFRAVQIRPRLGALTAVHGSMVHPHGTITVDLQVDDGALHGAITLPDGVPGALLVDGRSRALVPGHNRIEG
jgi:hypothetical protein